MAEKLTSEQMDAAAKDAFSDLENLTDEAVLSVAEWFAGHYLAAGHKRLGRILVAISKDPARQTAEV